MRIVARLQSALNAALWQNHVPMLSELSNATLGDEPLGDVEIELGCQPQVLQSRAWQVAGLGPGHFHVFDELASRSMARSCRAYRKRSVGQCR